jgi:hypothetical protein
MAHYDAVSNINLGTSEDLSIRELAGMVREIVHPAVRPLFDTDKPDVTPRKLLGVSRPSRLGWRHGIELRRCIADTYEWFAAQSVAVGNRRDQREGVGVAIRTALGYAIDQECDVLVVMAGDGQRRPDEVSRLVLRSSPVHVTWCRDLRG